MNRLATNNGCVETQTLPSSSASSDAEHEATAAAGERETASGRETAPGGRDSDGKFAKGNLGGPGNPFARQTAALRKELINSVTRDDIRAIAHKLMEQSKSGDVPSAKLLLGYLIGKPAPAVDPDLLNLLE